VPGTDRAATMPMFPLGTVLMPHMVLPLHVFEPRYRELVEDVLAGSREFGVTLITRGHEVGGGDERTDVGTVAQVLDAEELADGRWVLIALGTRRLRVTRWLPDDPYPRAEVVDAEEVHDDGEVLEVRDALAPRLRRVLSMAAALGTDVVPPTVELDDDPAVACWQPAVIAPLTPLDAQELLDLDRCADRLRLLDEQLEGLEATLSFRLGTGA
jgi:uncharacterized protein